jgi:hypothetical protein
MSANLDTGQILGVLGVLSLCGSAYMLGTLQGRTEGVGREVEQSIQTGIESGVDRALAPERLEDRGRAAGRGLAAGAAQGALDAAMDEEVHARGRAALRTAVREADAVAAAGLDLLEASFERAAAGATPRSAPAAGLQDEADLDLRQRDPSTLVPSDAAIDGTPGASQPASPGAGLAEDVGRVSAEAADLGLDLLDAMLAPERSRGPGAAERRDADPERPPPPAAPLEEDDAPRAPR